MLFSCVVGSCYSEKYRCDQIIFETAVPRTLPLGNALHIKYPSIQKTVHQLSFFLESNNLWSHFFLYSVEPKLDLVIQSHSFILS